MSEIVQAAPEDVAKAIINIVMVTVLSGLALAYISLPVMLMYDRIREHIWAVRDRREINKRRHSIALQNIDILERSLGMKQEEEQETK